ncbi:MAG: amidase [Chloroflexi bacterium]|nr:MAG: amidase [Chloroflexota bacterium]
MSDYLPEASIAELQARMTSGVSSAREITAAYCERIHAIDPLLHSVLEINPDAVEIAAGLDAERQQRGPRGPLHGIPILLKDNIDTDDRMQTTAGSLALIGSRPAQDATVTARLRAAGAVILGKANLSEWANFRSTHSISGWSARGGQCQNPYRIGHNPCGSSSGSGVAVSANLSAAALGTETDGSIVCPSATCGIVGIKPTVGLVSRAGVIPIAHSQDSVGPMTRTVADGAAILGALTGLDARDEATAASAGRFHQDYTQFLDPNGLAGARIGVARARYFGYHTETDRVIERALAAMRDAGALIVDPANIPTATDDRMRESELAVLLYELKADIASYLATRIRGQADRLQPRTLADLITFNREYADLELTPFGQELFEMAQGKSGLSDAEYRDALVLGRRLAGVEGIDAVMDAHQLDALVAPTGAPAWHNDPQKGDRYVGGSSRPAAVAGYPLITVPAGFVDGLPVGITFMGRAWTEPTLIRLAYAFEQKTLARRAPQL